MNINNPMWKGDKVGYCSLHEYVKNRLPKPKLCECCKKVPPRDLANKGIYDRNLKNWEWLCRKCHMTKDGRIKKLVNYDKNSPFGENCHYAKLTEKDIKNIRKEYSTKKYLQKDLAKKYGVSRQNIGTIVNNLSWKHI